MDKNSLAHTKWECKYHIVFAPKYRRKVIYNQIRADIGHILSELCKRKVYFCAKKVKKSENFNKTCCKERKNKGKNEKYRRL